MNQSVSQLVTHSLTHSLTCLERNDVLQYYSAAQLTHEHRTQILLGRELMKTSEYLCSQAQVLPLHKVRSEDGRMGGARKAGRADRARRLGLVERAGRARQAGKDS